MSATGDSPPLEIKEIISKTRAEQIIDEIKSAARDEMLSRMRSLISLAFRKALNPKSRPEIQQRWFTIAGYLAQVTARIVRDLEYEKLRADVEDLKKMVSNKFVNTTRRTGNQA